LAQFAQQNQRNPATNAERPLLRQVWAALRAWDSNYDYQKSNYSFDIQSFEPKRR
jgi:hypothetical protein